MQRDRKRGGQFEPWLDHAPNLKLMKKTWRRRPKREHADDGAPMDGAHVAVALAPNQPWWTRD
jgi:hypothetical protein